MLFQMHQQNFSLTFQTHVTHSVSIFDTQFFQVADAFFIEHGKMCLDAGSCNNATTLYRLAFYKTEACGTQCFVITLHGGSRNSNMCILEAVVMNVT